MAGCLLAEPRHLFWPLLPDWAEQVPQRPWDLREVDREGSQPAVAGAGAMQGGWGDDVAACAAPVDVPEQPGAIAGAGGGEVVMPAAAGPHQRPLEVEVVAGGPAAQRRLASPAVDVEDVGELAGDQADIGVWPALPPGGYLTGVSGGVVEAVSGAGVFADRAAAGVAARAPDAPRLPSAAGLGGVVER